MKVVDLVAKYSWPDLQSVLFEIFERQKEHYDDEDKKLHYSRGMSKALLLLKAMKPEKDSPENGPQNIRLEVEEDLCITGFDMDKPESDDRYGLGATKWSVILDYNIGEETLKNYSEPRILVETLWDMTFYGYDEEEIRKQLTEGFDE
eukprot:Phypoly_transcript_26526.p1 GENE.Phypoly_transcript_26526~~Phypoly_transcript_26526.p1  ORF type:complete len:158 (+),score=39.67 Phypoly_transcript_26526:31-474(+)